MHRLVISTIGTSLLTNQVKDRIDPKDWNSRLNETANYTHEYIEQYEKDVLKIILKLKERAEKQLFDEETDITEIRNISAELNGIYGLYAENLDLGISDTHILIATDTAQGEIAAKLIESFLKNQGINNTISLIQPELSLASTTVFTESMAKLIPAMQDTIQKYKDDKHQICLNLVGGFKALQGYFNTIGMFYADEIIYVFEGANNQVIKIPKLPISIDTERVEQYKVQLAMMAVGEIPAFWEEAKKVPKEWVLIIDKEMTLSTWGQLIWSQCKDILLSKNLLDYSNIGKLDYTDNFKEDYKNTLDTQEKIHLQERIARSAYILSTNNDGISALKNDDIVRLRRYQGTDIDHINITAQTRRVSCKVAAGGRLSLRYYGTHEYIYKREGIKK
ncbi:MAG: putative CRISPR-associated protein [Goleter apudmare HA4340-LM2]|jgi:putative CRISPR-associated protein (TIGR02619 family)|nr:putative CRISPR-associated protein [Goleter apudmare HA4340-LM2]